MAKQRLRRILWTVWAGALAAAAVAAGCSKPPAPSGARPARIVGFSPAITQILFDMGLGEQVVGVTRFCKLPPGVERPRVGDAMNLHAESILAVRPDVIFTQSSPDKFQGVRDIDPHVRVVQIDLERLADIPAAMERIGEALGLAEPAGKRRADFLARLQAVRDRVAGLPRPRVLFVMGTDRPTAAGPDNFIADLIDLAGGVNAGADIPGAVRWRPTHVEAILKAAPDVLVCQVSGGPEQREAARAYWLKWRDLPAAAGGRVHVVTDDRWSIPSTHLAELAPRLAAMIHPPPATGSSAPAGGPSGSGPS